MTTNQKKSILRKAGVTFYMQGGSVIRSAYSPVMETNLTQPMHYSVTSIAQAVSVTWDNPDLQDHLKQLGLVS